MLFFRETKILEKFPNLQYQDKTFLAGKMYIGVSKKKTTFHWLLTAYVSNTLTLFSARLLGK